MTTKDSNIEVAKKSVQNMAFLSAIVGFTGLVFSRYKTSRSNQWLVRTGLNVPDMEIAKKFIQWPFQNIQTIDMTPRSFKFCVNAMSREKMEFLFPIVFTISVKNNMESLQKYARLLLPQTV